MDESGAIEGLERTETRLRTYAAERGLTPEPAPYPARSRFRHLSPGTAAAWSYHYY